MVAGKVFGDPITDAVLMGIDEYQRKAHKDRADVALQWKGKKYDDAKKYVKGLKDEWDGGRICTFCLVYNATGESLKLGDKRNFYGNLYNNEEYPQVIENGQWAAFMHVKPDGLAHGSEAAVVYQGKNMIGEKVDFLLAWNNPYNKRNSYNQAYTVIYEGGKVDSFDKIRTDLENADRQHRANLKGCSAKVIIQSESDDAPIFEAVLTLN